MSQKLINLSNALSGRLWSDALCEEEAVNTVSSSSNTNVSVDVVERNTDELVGKGNFISNKWMDEVSVANLRTSLNTYENAVVEPIVVTKNLDYSHPAVINYINADLLCSTLWRAYLELREFHKNSTEDAVKVSSLEDVIGTLKEWIVASEDRFATMREIKRVGNFDFEQCFRDYFPKEESRVHCADMESTYNTVTSYRLNNHKDSLRKLKKKLSKK